MTLELSGILAIIVISACRQGADVVFALDSSGSIGRKNYQKEVDFVREVIHGLNLNSDSRVGVVVYSNTPSILMSLNQYSNKMSVLSGLGVR